MVWSASWKRDFMINKQEVKVANYHEAHVSEKWRVSTWRSENVPEFCASGKAEAHQWVGSFSTSEFKR